MFLLLLKFPLMTSSSRKQSIVCFGKETSFQVNKWALLKLLCTVDRGCAKLLWFTPSLTPLLCQPGGIFEAQEHLGEKANSIF